MTTFLDPHNHRCANCPTVWHHDPSTIPYDEEINKRAHSCPKCGTEQYEIDDSGAKPVFCCNGDRIKPLEKEPIYPDRPHVPLIISLLRELLDMAV